MKFESRISPVHIVLILATLVGLGVAFYFALAIGQGQHYQLIGLGILCIGLAWAIGGSKIWWLPIFFFPSLGGLVYVGFKIYVQELAVILCVIPLILALATNRFASNIRRNGLQHILFVLLIYLSIHYLGCISYTKAMGLGGLGNITRRYADAIWPILFLIPFLYFGDSRFLKWAMRLMYSAFLLRACIAFYGVYAGVEGTMYIPMINYVLPSGGTFTDLRASGPMLVSLGIVYFCVYRRFIPRVFNLCVIGIGSWGTLLGSSRLIMVSLILLFGLSFLIYKKWGLIFGLVGVSIIVILLINSAPEILYKLPDSGRRAATAFMLDRSAAADAGQTEASDEWHARLISEGWKSWTENPFTFLFGRGVGAFQEDAWFNAAGQQEFEGMIIAAVATSRFEKGLWDTLCTFGLVGLVLFTVVLFTVVRQLMRTLFRERISSIPLALAFIASFQCLNWVLLCWIGGTFPSTPIMLAIIAKIALDDMRTPESSPEPVSNQSLPPAQSIAMNRRLGRPDQG
jgi:hypothetical protein